MKTLIIHHLETMWDSGFKKFGTNFETQCMEIAEHLEETSYDRVILTRFEEWELEPEHYPIAHHINVIHPYGYGWEDEIKESDPHNTYVEGGNHSEWVLVDDWMKELRHDEVFICGAFDGECIEDLEIALESLNIEPKRIEELIV